MYAGGMYEMNGKNFNHKYQYLYDCFLLFQQKSYTSIALDSEHNHVRKLSSKAASQIEISRFLIYHAQEYLSSQNSLEHAQFGDNCLIGTTVCMQSLQSRAIDPLGLSSILNDLDS